MAENLALSGPGGERKRAKFVEDLSGFLS